MKFSEKEIDFIKHHYSTHGNKYCSEKLNRNKGSVQKIAHKLNLKVNRALMIKNNPELLCYLQQHAREVLQPINDNNKINLNINEIEVLYKKGTSIAEIAKLYKCSTIPIGKLLKSLPKRKSGEYLNHRSKHQFGEKNASWKGGIKSIYDRIRGLCVYWTWHKEVLSRDNNTCQHCSCTANLQVHHRKTLKSLVLAYCILLNKEPKDLTENELSSEHFYAIDNGLTLCKTCHKKHHKEFGR